MNASKGHGLTEVVGTLARGVNTLVGRTLAPEGNSQWPHQSGGSSIGSLHKLILGLVILVHEQERDASRAYS